MINVNSLKFCCLVLLSSLCLSHSAFAQTSLLWNSGPKWRSVIHANADTPEGVCQITAITEMYEGASAGNPSGWCPQSPKMTCNGTDVTAPNYSCPTLYHNTTGWTQAEFGKWPGWAVYHLSGGGGTPMVTRLLSNSYASPNPCLLREVSQTYAHYTSEKPIPNPPVWGFQQQYSLNQYAQFHGKFSARLNRTLGPSSCAATPSAYVTADVGIKYLDGNGVTVRTDTLGVLIYNMNDYDMNGNAADNIFYTNRVSQTACNPSNRCIALLHGNKLGIPVITGNYQNWDIEYKTLITQYLPPPPANSVSAITSWEVYPSTRGADIEVDVTNMDFVGQ